MLCFLRSNVLRHRASPLTLQVTRAATIIVVDLGPRAVRGTVAEHLTTAPQALHEAGQPPEASAGVTELHIVPYSHPGSVNPLARDPGVWHRNCYPLLPRFLS